MFVVPTVLLLLDTSKTTAMTKSWKFRAAANLDLHFDSTIAFNVLEILENESLFMSGGDRLPGDPSACLPILYLRLYNTINFTIDFINKSKSMTKRWTFQAAAILDLYFDSTIGFTTLQNLENETYN